MKNIGLFLFSLYLWGVVTGVTAGVSLLILLSFPLALFDRDRRFAHGLGILWAHLLTKLNPFWTLRVEGTHSLRKETSYVLVANHSSLADIVCLFSLGHQFKWLAKRSLFQVPLFGWAMRVMGYVPLERGRHGSIRESYQESLDWLRKGISVLIFPEGTRSRSGEMGKFKSGAFRLAIESGRPLLPIVLAGTRNVISKGRTAFGTPGSASMTILPPVETKGLKMTDEEKLRERVESLMQKELTEKNRALAG